MKSRIHLGCGVLTWERMERVSDRYGTVYLMPNGNNSHTTTPVPSVIGTTAAGACEDQHGTLLAIVRSTRQSSHIGDVFRGVFPRTPKVGDIIKLGIGTFFTAPLIDGGGFVVGLTPDDGRDTDWLSIRSLYDAHEQTVDLFFETEAA